MAPTATIVGGGLAGMAAALRLQQEGLDVSIFEASSRLGGKAGANRHADGRYDEHGWHLFPLWYVNIYALADELGFSKNFVDKTRYAYMGIGEYPSIKYLENPFSWKTAFHNLFNGIVNPIDGLLYQYTGIDLMSQPTGKKAQLDQITVNGFARSRFYCTDRVVDQLEDTVSRASAIESFEMSAMTVRNVMRYWLRYHSPWFRILNGDLQSRFIEPFSQALNCKVHLDSKVVKVHVENGRASAIDVLNNGNVRREAVENLLLTSPILDTRALLDESLLQVAPELSGTLYLRSRIMGGMTAYFGNKIAGIPIEHLNFVGSPYALSMLDVTDLWSSQGTVLAFVASDMTTLQKHSPAGAQAALIADLKRYLPFLANEVIDRIDFQPHVDQPLFANTAGAWPRRPHATTQCPNVFVAGDYCKSDIDLTCMEGAVVTGLLAAEAIRKSAGIGQPIKVLLPKTYPRAFLLFLKYIGLPVATLVFLVARLRDVFADDGEQN